MMSRPILKEIDTALAEHYVFKAEEWNFILADEINFLLGRSAETDAE